MRNHYWHQWNTSIIPLLIIPRFEKCLRFIIEQIMQWPSFANTLPVKHLLWDDLFYGTQMMVQICVKSLHAWGWSSVLVFGGGPSFYLSHENSLWQWMWPLTKIERGNRKWTSCDNLSQSFFKKWPICMSGAFGHGAFCAQRVRQNTWKGVLPGNTAVCWSSPLASQLYSNQWFVVILTCLNAYTYM